MKNLSPEQRDGNSVAPFRHAMVQQLTAMSGWQNQPKPVRSCAMKTLPVSDAMCAALQRFAEESHSTADAILTALLTPTGDPHTQGMPIAEFVSNLGYREPHDQDERYLSLLGWIATRHATEFGEFVRAQRSHTRYLRMSNDAIVATCRQHHARQIDATPYWAILNIPPEKKLSFATRLLEFIGYGEVVVGFVQRALRRAAIEQTSSAN